MSALVEWRVAALLLGILNFFYNLFHSYGIAIILLNGGWCEFCCIRSRTNNW
ncbi:hypothetical protein [Aminiphilus circumscriptus]|uniref:hypothetical protein n=1 Tax=Aminiphilus circumscriptus TaxID=290732 RepID=UPI001FDFCF78|nr:hypothetical protein [Aminiphilus circumscriptus]